MILHLHREALFVGVRGRPFWHGPGFEDAIAFQAEVIMKPGGRMLLDDEKQRPAAAFGQRGRWLGGSREPAFGGIFSQAIFCHTEF